MQPVKSSGWGFFIAGSIGLIAGGILHMWGQFGGGPPGLARAAVEAAMRATTSTLMGMTYSLWGVMQCWGVYFGALAMFAGVQNLVAAAFVSHSPMALRWLAGASGACAAILLAIAIHFRIAPPIVTFSLVFACFAAAAALAFRDGDGA
jgi:hypothetical protein